MCFNLDKCTKKKNQGLKHFFDSLKRTYYILYGCIIFGVGTYRYLGINTFFTFYQKNSETNKFSC